MDLNNFYPKGFESGAMPIPNGTPIGKINVIKDKQNQELNKGGEQPKV